MNDEKSQPAPENRKNGFALSLLSGGCIICLLATIESFGGLPIRMPSSWYIYRPIWLAIGIVAILAGLTLQKPPRGDENDTH